MLLRRVFPDGIPAREAAAPATINLLEEPSWVELVRNRGLRRRREQLEQREERERLEVFEQLERTIGFVAVSSSPFEPC